MELNTATRSRGLYSAASGRLRCLSPLANAMTSGVMPTSSGAIFNPRFMHAQ